MKQSFRGIGIYLLIALIVVFFAYRYNTNATEPKEIIFTELVSLLNQDRVVELNVEGRNYRGVLKDGVEFKGKIGDLEAFSFYDNYLKNKVNSSDLKYNAGPEKQVPFYYSLLPMLLVIGLFAIFWFVFMQQSQGGGGKAMNFGKSRARMVNGTDPEKVVKFADVAGLAEEKEELSEVVDFLKNPRKYIEIGARIPTGVLLVGPPGTGKTYLSRAVAGEANVPFFTISGSDFVEMFVGVGASRVRDLFEDAKKNAPCIVFIDEIDAVGRRRGAGLGGGHDEREQTLNQLLVEMDGFSKNEGIIVMAATNRADILDPALLRPGRFDRQIYVGLPDVKEREAILLVHTKKKPLADDADLKVVAKRTPGFSPADLENLINEAAIMTAKAGLKKIPMNFIEEASIKVQAGPEKKSKIVSEEERKLTAYHEAGHALVSRLTPETDPVHMVTIVPRGMAGGFTAYIPEEDRSYMTKGRMKSRLVSLLGGRVAEALVLDDISTGAQNDIERATKIARSMVTHYGMSDKLGPMTYGTDDEEVFVGRDFGRARNYSEEVAAKIDEEMRSLIDEAYHKAEKIMRENIDRLHRIAQALLEKETISGNEFEALFQGKEYNEETSSMSAEAAAKERDRDYEQHVDQKIEKKIREIEEENERRQESMNSEEK